jgi:uncharacterized lipoprotein YmbA
MKVLLVLLTAALAGCSSPGEKMTVFEQYMLNRASAPKHYTTVEMRDAPAPHQNCYIDQNYIYCN